MTHIKQGDLVRVKVKPDRHLNPTRREFPYLWRHEFLVGQVTSVLNDNVFVLQTRDGQQTISKELGFGDVEQLSPIQFCQSYDPDKDSLKIATQFRITLSLEEERQLKTGKLTVDFKTSVGYCTHTVERQEKFPSTNSQKERQMAKQTNSTTANKPNKGATKKAQAIKIVSRMRSRKNVPARKTILNELREKLDMTEATAATYYQNITSGKWS